MAGIIKRKKVECLACYIAKNGIFLTKSPFTSNLPLSYGRESAAEKRWLEAGGLGQARSSVKHELPMRIQLLSPTSSFATGPENRNSVRLIMAGRPGFWLAESESEARAREIFDEAAFAR
jgi:hypothetical protein